MVSLICPFILLLHLSFSFIFLHLLNHSFSLSFILFPTVSFSSVCLTFNLSFEVFSLYYFLCSFVHHTLNGLLFALLASSMFLPLPSLVWRVSLIPSGHAFLSCVIFPRHSHFSSHVNSLFPFPSVFFPPLSLSLPFTSPALPLPPPFSAHSFLPSSCHCATSLTF